MPKTITTGETITLTDLRIEHVSFSWVQEPIDPEADPVELHEVLHCHATYARLKDDGSVHDRCVCEVEPDEALLKEVDLFRAAVGLVKVSEEGI